MPERRHPGVRQVELLDHSRRELSLMIVVVVHWLTVPLPWLNRTRYGLDAQPK